MMGKSAKLKILIIFFVIGLIIFLNQVFSGRWILPQTFALGPITVHYYGFVIACAVAGGFYLAKKRAEKYGIDSKTAEDIIFWLIVGGLIGARLYHILSSFGYYQDHIVDMVKVWQGGLSIYGAVLGGLASAIFLSKRYRLSATHLLNWLTPSLILGQIVGRFGNLFNYEAYGLPTNLPWKMFVPFGFRIEGYQIYNYFHPWFLYEQIGLLIIYFIINRLQNKQLDPGYRANLFVWYLLLYNVLRFGLEFLRVDSVFNYGIRQNALVSLIIIAISIIFFRTSAPPLSNPAEPEF